MRDSQADANAVKPDPNDGLNSSALDENSVSEVTLDLRDTSSRPATPGSAQLSTSEQPSGQHLSEDPTTETPAEGDLTPAPTATEPSFSRPGSPEPWIVGVNANTTCPYHITSGIPRETEENRTVNTASTTIEAERVTVGGECVTVGEECATVEESHEQGDKPAGSGTAELAQMGYMMKLPRHPHKYPRGFFLGYVTEDPNNPASEESKAAARDFDVSVISGGTFRRTVGIKWKWPDDMDFGDPSAYVRAAQSWQNEMSTQVPAQVHKLVSEYKKEKGLPEDAFTYAFDDEKTFMSRYPHPSKAEEFKDMKIDWSKTFAPDWKQYTDDLSRFVGTKEKNEKPILYAMTVMTKGPSYTDATCSSMVPAKSSFVPIVTNLPGYEMNPESKLLAEEFGRMAKTEMDRAASQVAMGDFSEIEDPKERLKKTFAKSYWDIKRQTQPTLERLYSECPHKDRFKMIPVKFWEHPAPQHPDWQNRLNYSDYCSALDAPSAPSISPQPVDQPTETPQDSLAPPEEAAQTQTPPSDAPQTDAAFADVVHTETAQLEAA
ncbi:hypothetical protein IAT40_005190 [Kwoniella sp. CBS 6097]